jgi:hypothetical protein
MTGGNPAATSEDFAEPPGGWRLFRPNAAARNISGFDALKSEAIPATGDADPDPTGWPFIANPHLSERLRCDLPEAA